MSIQTIPSLSKQLKGVTDCIIGEERLFLNVYIFLTSFFLLQCVTSDYHVTGLQYVWEYRSPSKSVPPHYHCKLCAVSHLQQDMLAHVKGWKHCLKYLVSLPFSSSACLKAGILLYLLVIFVYITALRTAKSLS